MDTFSFRRLSRAGCVLVTVLLLAVGALVPRAAYAYQTYDQAMSYCQAQVTYDLANKYNIKSAECVVRSNSSGNYLTNYECGTTWSCRDGQAWYFSGSAPPTDQQKCAARPSYPALLGSNLTVCNAGCSYAPKTSSGDDGAKRTCVRQPDGSSVCEAHTNMVPTGATCGGTPPPDTPPPPPPPPPRLCGGGSCYDPITGNACALNAAGQQVCYNFASGSGCMSSGETTLCGGAPPPIPPAGAVPDPPANLVASDTYTQQATDAAGAGTGAVASTTVNNYNNGTTSGAPTPDNGKADGDVGGDPAPSSSTGGTPRTASGGGDCNTPPVCSGDAIDCLMVRQLWQDKCMSKDIADAMKDLGIKGEGDPSFVDHTVSEVDSGTVDLGDTSKLDTSGFGYGTACPFHVVEISVGDKVAAIPMDKICEYGPWMRAFILLLAALKCADILGRK